ncbi:membrane protein [Sulfolobus acidocaldarius SUSAZ]|nr:membrane protein [Sulfolobus acidocaldarius SUSAZ]
MIYIDIDDDLGSIGISTPVIGQEEVVKAIRIAEEKIPTDSDLNTLLVAYNIYNKIRNEGSDVEIALISGSQKGSLESQLAFTEKLDMVIKAVNPTKAIIVYDSPEDAKAIPIIESRLQVAGIERVLVEQYRSVEETYVLLGRYIKKALSEPRFSKIFLGVPGIILLIIGLLSILNLTSYATPVVLIIIGAAFIIRGLRLDETVEELWKSSSIMVVVSIIFIFSVVLGIVYGYSVFTTLKSYGLLEVLQVLFSIMPFLIFGIVVLFGGRAVTKLLDRNIRVWHDIYRIITTVVIYYMMVTIYKSIGSSLQVLQLQIIYSLSITTIVLIGIYILLILLEKYKFNNPSTTS